MAGKPDQDTTDGAPQPRRIYEPLDARKRPSGGSPVPGYPVRHETIFDSIADGFFVLDKEWRCTYINKAGAASLGTTPDRLIGNPFWGAFPNVSRTRCQEQCARAIQQRAVITFEDCLEPPGHWYEYRCHPSGDGLTVFFTDITERKQMESKLLRLNQQLEEEVKTQTEEMAATIDRLQDEVTRRVLAEGKLRKRSQMLEAFFRHTITPLAFLDRSFNFIRVNEAYAKADNKTPGYFVGRNHFLLYPDTQLREIFERVVRTREPYRAFAKPFTYPDGSAHVRYWNWQLTPLLNEAGEVKFLVFNLEDVTEQQHAVRELKGRALQLQKLALELSQAEDRERKRLAEILHDDLQQVLAAAKFHLGMMNVRTRGDTEMEEMAVQIDALLKEAIGKSRSLSHELSPAVLYQSDLGETFEWLARQLHSKHGLTVHVEIRGQIDPQSEPLRAFLYRAAQEILFNVVKHAQVEEARLRLQRIGSRVWLTISDRGRGFNPKALHRAGGFGLLSIHERVQLLGGRMKIRSMAGKGSTFLISVPDAQIAEDPPHIAQGAPREPLDARRPAQDTHRAPSGDASVLRVLLVDDHKVVREGLAALLRTEQDIEIVGQAANGLEAIALAKRLRPHVIVMDVAMPVMSGEEATRHIKERLPQVRVVALSMYEEASVAERMHRAGAETYLLKTSPAEELLAAIRGHPPTFQAG